MFSPCFKTFPVGRRYEYTFLSYLRFFVISEKIILFLLFSSVHCFWFSSFLPFRIATQLLLTFFNLQSFHIERQCLKESVKIYVSNCNRSIRGKSYLYLFNYSHNFCNTVGLSFLFFQVHLRVINVY